jgi:ParB family chromosome partitioning protein
MAKRPALGRGLAALLGEGSANEAALESQAALVASAPPASRGVIDLSVSVIRRNPRQPRRAFDSAALDELATSIASVGVVQPVIVREVAGGYELIAGERRWRAAQKAGFTVIPAIVRVASDVESLELALVENVVRQQLNPVDEAYALKVLLDDLGVTQENLAARVGKSRSAIANKIRLLDLPAGIQEALSSGTLSEGHGRALLGLTERGRQLQLARRVVDKGLSVRQVEEEVRRLTDGSRSESRHKESPLDPEIVSEVRDAFFASLGVIPRVKGRGSGGVIELHFKDGEELQRLVGRLGS